MIIRMLLFWGLFIVTLVTDTFLLKRTQIHAVLLLITSQLVMAVWMLVCLGIAVWPSEKTGNSASQKAKSSNSYMLWEKCFMRKNNVPWLLSDLFFALSIVDLAGNWRLGMLFLLVQWTYFSWYRWVGNTISDKLSDFMMMDIEELDNGNNNEEPEVEHACEAAFLKELLGSTLQTEELVKSEIREFLLLKNVFVSLLVVADVAVGCLGNRYQAVSYYAWQIPWILRECSLELRGMLMAVTICDSEGNEVYSSTSKFRRLLTQTLMYATSCFSMVAFVAALLAAGTDRRLALLMVIGRIARDMAEDCDRQLWYRKMDQLFGKFNPKIGGE